MYIVCIFMWSIRIRIEGRKVTHSKVVVLAAYFTFSWPFVHSFAVQSDELRCFAQISHFIVIGLSLQSAVIAFSIWVY